MTWKGPLANRYSAAVVLVLAALVPYLALSSALEPLMQVIERSVHLGPEALSLTTGMANAAYALGTVVSLQLAQRLPQRRMLIAYSSLFVIGSVLAATAPTPGLFIAGHVVQGLCTSLMLVAAVPPLTVGWPAGKLPFTAVTLSLGIFGAVAAGPLVGGVQADAGAWRPLFWIVTGIGVLALVMAVLTFSDDPPVDPQYPIDWVALILAGVGVSAAFFGASQLEVHDLHNPVAITPIAVGAASIVALVIYEFFAPSPLMPVRKLWTTLPVGSTVIAMSAGAASVALIELTQTAFADRGSPLHTGVLFWPEFAGALITSFIFGSLVRTRLLPSFILSGMVVLVGGAAVLIGVATGPEILVLIGSGLVGLGVGASVAPALFVAGFALQPEELQGIYALLELLRGSAAFLVAPIFLYVARTTASSPRAGIHIAVWASLGIAAFGALLTFGLWLLGRLPQRAPDLDSWLASESPATHSPPLLAALRPGPPPPMPAGLTAALSGLALELVARTVERDGAAADPRLVSALARLAPGEGDEVDRARRAARQMVRPIARRALNADSRGEGLGRDRQGDIHRSTTVREGQRS